MAIPTERKEGQPAIPEIVEGWLAIPIEREKGQSAIPTERKEGRSAIPIEMVEELWVDSTQIEKE